MYKDLNASQRLIVLLARKTFSSAAIAEVVRSLECGVDWYDVLNGCIRNKILPLAWQNLNTLKLAGKVPHKIRELCSFYTLGVARKNQALFAQFRLISSALTSAGIRFAPLKGLVLVNEVYTMDSRQMNDFDLMISKDDRSRVRALLNSLGFYESEYDYDSRSLRPLDRRQKALWGLYMYNLPAFMKLIDAEYLQLVEVDFTFDIRFNSTKSAAAEFLSHLSFYESLGCEVLQAEEFLLHLCCHLHKEAKNVLWVEKEADFNLIKFCDVREYVLHSERSLDFERFLGLARKYEVEAAVYFTFHYVSQIYADGYERTLLSRLPAFDEEALGSYGERDLGKGIAVTGSFWRRFFKTDYLPDQNERSIYSSLVRPVGDSDAKSPT
jgi:Uncharacterised nucleotidyltransferase